MLSGVLARTVRLLGCWLWLVQLPLAVVVELHGLRLTFSSLQFVRLVPLRSVPICFLLPLRLVFLPLLVRACLRLSPRLLSGIVLAQLCILYVRQALWRRC